jgi:hypothetical protein
MLNRDLGHHIFEGSPHDVSQFGAERRHGMVSLPLRKAPALEIGVTRVGAERTESGGGRWKTRPRPVSNAPSIGAVNCDSLQLPKLNVPVRSRGGRQRTVKLPGPTKIRRDSLLFVLVLGFVALGIFVSSPLGTTDGRWSNRSRRSAWRARSRAGALERSGPRHQWPQRRAADPYDKLPPSHFQPLSDLGYASTCNLHRACGLRNVAYPSKILIHPLCRIVLRRGCTGRSAGFSPLRMRST